MRTTTFELRGNTEIKTIQCRVSYGRNNIVRMSTGLKVDASKWNIEKERPNPSNAIDKANISKLNEIDRLINDDTQTTILTTEWLKNTITPKKETVGPPSSLVEFLQYFIDTKKIVKKSTYIEKMTLLKSIVERFEKSKSHHYFINEIDDKFYSDFFSYLTRNEKYSDGTASRHFKNLKTICFEARKNGIPISEQLIGIRMKGIEREDPIFLDKAEIEKIRKVELPFDYLQNARDHLVISCLTGQRVSDFLRNTKSNLFEKEGRTHLNFNQKKTSSPVSLPLHPIVVDIINNRNGDFPHKISAVKYNKYIKIVCRLAGINDLTNGFKTENITLKVNGNKRIVKRRIEGKFPKYELVTSHIGRRSFATNHYGLATNAAIMASTGHKSESSFLKYINKTNNNAADEMIKLWYNKS